MEPTAQLTNEVSHAATHVRVIYYVDYIQSQCLVKYRYLSLMRACEPQQEVSCILKRQSASQVELVCHYLIGLPPLPPKNDKQ